MSAEQVGTGLDDGVTVGISGGKVSLYGATAVVRASAITAPATTAATQSSPFGYATSTQADAINTAVRSIITALANVGITA